MRALGGLLFVLLFLPQIARAQLPQPAGKLTPADPPASVDAFRRYVLRGGEFVRRGMVWRPDAPRNQWVQAEANSCEFCQKPMSWKAAAFDKKALPLWLTAAALSVADTEYTLSRPCIQDGTCREWNPLLGQTRAQQYAVRMPLLALVWMTASRLRKGDTERQIGGMRHWYLIPVIYMGMPAAGLAANAITTQAPGRLR
jgi:hypothetical protein